ncbi:cupin domain-containing protein [Paenibacillus lautus]|uniref:cupin domain-containing protein n=1 Tax=Paenibacillus lautus TaxID=1401 RepID=UPI003D28BB04
MANVSSLELPLLQGMMMSEIHLERGKGLSPHSHPDTDELCYVIQGEISYSLIDPVTHQNLVYQIVPGQVVHAPMDWCHWITALTPGTILLLVYNTERPHQIDIASVWAYTLMGAEALQCDDTYKKPHSKALITPVSLHKMESDISDDPLPAPPLLITGHPNNKTTRSR